MSCCKKECKIIKTINITTTSEPEGIQLEIPQNSFVENERFYLIISQCLPSFKSVPVEIISGKETIPVFNRIGNYLRGDQLKGKKILYCVYGSDATHILVFNHMRDSAVAGGVI